MLSKYDVRDCLHQGLSEAGFKRRQLTWKSSHGEVAWLIHLDKLPIGKRFGIDIGIHLQIEGVVMPESITMDECPINLGAESLLPDCYEVVAMTYTDYDRISDSERSAGLVKIGYALGEYAHGHRTIGSILDAYRREEFRGALIRKEVRVLLDGALPNRTEK